MRRRSQRNGVAAHVALLLVACSKGNHASPIVFYSSDMQSWLTYDPEHFEKKARTLNDIHILAAEVSRIVARENKTNTVCVTKLVRLSQAKDWESVEHELYLHALEARATDGQQGSGR